MLRKSLMVRPEDSVAVLLENAQKVTGLRRRGER